MKLMKHLILQLFNSWHNISRLVIDLELISVSSESRGISLRPIPE